MQHDVRASREAAGTNSPAVKSSVQKGTWLYRRQADSKTLRARQKTLWAAEDLSKETVLSTVGEQAYCDARPSRIRLTHRKSESHGNVRRLLEIASSWRLRVASLGSTQGAASERVWVAPPRNEQWRERGSTAKVDGWIIKDRVDVEANLPDLGADRNGSRGKDDLLATVQYVRHAKESRSRLWQNLTTEGSIQEARHKNETQLKSEDKILKRTPKQKRIRQSR